MTAYKGYIIRNLIAGNYSISKDGFHISYASNVLHARQIIDQLV